MVKSLLSSNIDYLENRHLLTDDKNSEATLYEITLFDKDETIALGQPVYTYIEHNIIYYPMYLVKNNKVTLQIGLYEIFADGLVTILDSDGDLDLDLIGQPLLYSFVEKELGPELAHAEAQAEAQAGAEAGAQAEAEAEAEADIVVAPLPEQTATDAANEKELYKADKKNHWIQAFMENNNYQMIENEGQGDCFFAVIRDGLATVGIQKSVADMRTILADNVTEDVFQGYKTIYKDAADTDAQLVKELKTLVARHKDLKAKIDALKDRNAKQVIIAQADELNKRHKEAKNERAYTKSVVEGELKIMKNVHNLTQFRALIKTCAFWGDTWAISTLERVMNIKIILFSEESFNAGDMDNVLTCGQLNDTVLEEKGIFQPDYYILTLYQGYHYQLISYKDKAALTFQEVPYDVKMKVVDKCLERMAGPYYIIPEFREFIEKLNQPSTIPYSDTTVLIEKDAMEDIQPELFNKFTVFQFYSKSITKPPGKGAGEIISANEMNEYTDLSRIPDWRKKLSNFWIAPFTLDGHKWSSVEHYYQGSKFKRKNPEFYLQFSLDSNSDLSKNSEMAKGAGGKSGKYSKVQIRPKNMTVDEDFFGSGKRCEKEMEAAQYAKFSQHEDLKYLLKSTKKAKLQHFSRGSPPIVFYDLMRVRQKLALTNNT